LTDLKRCAPDCGFGSFGAGMKPAEATRTARGILIFECSPSKLAYELIASFCQRPRPDRKDVMKLTVAAAALLVGAMQTAQASPGNRGLVCIAKVLHSEELPFAPVHHWLVRVTLQITPPNGGAFEAVLQDTIPWQAPPPRPGQTLRMRCDPANPTDLHLVHQIKTATP
jgi:hypothetical protein